MNLLKGTAALAIAICLSAPALAQIGGSVGGITSGTGDAAAQNLPSTVGVGRQTGNGYYTGPGGGERRTDGYGARSYDGRSAYRRGRRVHADPYGGPFEAPRVRGYGYGFGRYPY